VTTTPAAWSDKAWMSVKDADMLEAIVKRLSGAAPRLDVFEWGGGKSTVYFTKLLAKSRFSWTVAENNPEWAQKVRTEAPAADVRLIPLGDGYPGAIGLARPLLAIVDGRLRRRCMLAASEVAGLVVLHDAQRAYYHCAFSAYRYHRRAGDMLWIGSNHEPTFASVASVV